MKSDRLSSEFQCYDTRRQAHRALGLRGPGATINRFFPSLGNHDWATTGAQPYLDYFTLPNNERYYDVVWGPVHLFAIDSDPNEPDGVTSTSVQAGWLQGELAASTACWKLVYMHHPPYSSGSTHGSSTWMQWPYQSWGASVVMAGHDHDYERIIQGGFPYFVNGLGGRSIYSFGTPVSGSQVRYNGDYGAMLVDADEAGITFQFMSRTGTLIDTYTSTTSHCVLAAPTNLTAKAVSISRIDLAWTDNAGNEDGFSIEQSLNGTSFTQIGRVRTSRRTRPRAFRLRSPTITASAPTTAPAPPRIPTPSGQGRNADSGMARQLTVTQCPKVLATPQGLRG
ncbi:metallophosphoesterase [Candidatus Methylomirabilis sp.]|uniref:metallophosphoesterase n=1 Tax=Candidatus Methylomirabilis sp. TaxID=2032687 RepID=UPI003075FF77